MVSVARLKFDKIRELISIYLEDKQEVKLIDLVEDITPEYYSYIRGQYLGNVSKSNNIARLKDMESRLRPVIGRCLPLGWKKKIVRSYETIIFEGNVLKKDRRLTVLFKEEV
tara:strand:+ start:759 stop:1094 length:336 start_codon:yes stop_codon:yes gene_type:complete